MSLRGCVEYKHHSIISENSLFLNVQLIKPFRISWIKNNFLESTLNFENIFLFDNPYNITSQTDY